MMTLLEGRAEQGFAVLASTILLGAAAMLFTAHMASSQLLDNQIIANYYRSDEAFANAQSGVNFALAQLSEPIATQKIITNLPFEYNNPEHHYRVLINKVHARKVAITAFGTSIDGTALREINLEIDLYLNYPIPNAALSSNGKLYLQESVLINDGCEGLSKEACLAQGNVATNMLISNPSIEEDDDDFCTGDKLGENVISDGVLQGASEPKEVEVISGEGQVTVLWPAALIASGSTVAGITPSSELQPHSLFEATFGVEMSQANLDELWDSAVQIDMNNGGYCSDRLQAVSDEDNIIFIKGDCDISQYYAKPSKTSENGVFSIGSFEHPKLVFIEGGEFVADANVDTSVVGMLYFLPSKHDFVDAGNNPIGLDGKPLAAGQDIIQVEDTSVDMSGVSVSGALLSEYRCSHAGGGQNKGTNSNANFSVRFDKLALQELYSLIGMKATNSGYRLVSGTWRDF